MWNAQFAAARLRLPSAILATVSGGIWLGLGEIWVAAPGLLSASLLWFAFFALRGRAR